MTDTSVPEDPPCEADASLRGPERVSHPRATPPKALQDMEVDAQIARDMPVALLEPTDPGVAVPTPSVVEPQTWGDFRVLWRLCETITREGNQFAPRALWNRPESALSAILMGRELGLGDMVALQRIYVIEGKPTLAAELILGLVRRAGHSVTFGQRTRERCEVTGKRADNGDELTVEWTMDDASAAGLTGKDNWKHYPRAMLHARAVTELSRSLFSDCVGWAVYAPEDMDEHYE